MIPSPAILSKSIAVMLISLAVSLAGHSAQFGDFTYTDHGDYIEITDYPTDATGTVVVPQFIDSKPVTAIGIEAFYRCIQITAVTLPQGITTISDRAFAVCFSLSSINLPTSLRTIGDEAFHFTDLTAVSIPEGVTTLGEKAFHFSPDLTSVDLPSTLISIGAGAFQQTNITSIIIPVGITTIPENCFSFATHLQSISLPSGLLTIGRSAFSQTDLTEITIPESVTSIGGNAFSGCDKLATVLIPSAVNSIGPAAFAGCDKLLTFSVASTNPSFQSINGVLFDRSGALLVAYPGGAGVSIYQVPTGTTTLGAGAFNGNQFLSTVTLPESLQVIEIGCFQQASLESLSIPVNVTSIAPGAFSSCDNLKGFTLDVGNTFFEEIDGVLFDEELNTIVAYPSGKQDTQYIIPNSVTEIGKRCFMGNGLLESIVIPDSVHTLGASAFSLCTQLRKVEIPTSVNKIPDLAFFSCASLIRIQIPATVHTIASTSFLNTPLEEIYFVGNAPSGLGSFSSLPREVTVFFFEGALGFDSFPWTSYSTVSMGPESDRKLWLIDHELSYASNLNSTYGENGYPLLLSYAMNVAPDESSFLEKTETENLLHFRYYAGRADLSYSALSSSQLNGIWSTDGFTLSDIDSEGYRTATLNTTDFKQRFFKVEVTGP